VRPPRAGDEMETRQQKGRTGEELAEAFLETSGLKVEARNVRCPLGEIDIVARDGKTVVFVEVKSRRSIAHGLPQESVTRDKRRRLTRLARWYLKRYRLQGKPARFDVIAVTWEGGEPEVTWIVNAFDACD